MDMLTANFSRQEMACGCGCDAQMDQDFMDLLQNLRTAYGKAMKVTSGVRCPDHNAKVGGRVASMHLLGKAADILCTSDKDRMKLVSFAVTLGFRGIGISRHFVHIDLREGPAAMWSY